MCSSDLQNQAGKVKVYREETTDNLEYLGEYPFFGSEFFKVLPEGDYRFDIRTDASAFEIAGTVMHQVSEDDGNYVRP